MDPDQLDGLAQLDELGPQPQAEPAFLLPQPQAEGEGPQPQADDDFPDLPPHGADDAAARAKQTATITAMTFMVATIKTQHSSLEYIRNFYPSTSAFWYLYLCTWLCCAGPKKGKIKLLDHLKPKVLCH